MPFGPWKDFADCVSHMKRKFGHSDETAKKICGKLQSQLEG